MLHRSLFLLKNRFWPSYCQISTDLDKILHTPIVAWNTLVGQLRPQSARGRLQAKPERLFLPARLVSAVLAMETWLAGWLAVTLRCCVSMVKPILKLFRPSDSPIILVFSDPAPIPSSNGNPFSMGYIYTPVGKIGDFRRKSPLISETMRDRPMVTMEC